MLKNVLSRVRSGYASLGVAAAVLLCTASSVFAQSTAIPLKTIDLDWDAFSTEFMTAITSVITIAIGVGIGIWMLRMVYNFFKEFAVRK